MSPIKVRIEYSGMKIILKIRKNTEYPITLAINTYQYLVLRKNNLGFKIVGVMPRTAPVINDKGRTIEGITPIIIIMGLISITELVTNIDPKMTKEVAAFSSFLAHFMSVNNTCR